jgi:hypothetical protein
MTFNINQFNRSDYIEEEEAGAYQDALMELFLASPEGQARAEADPDLGFWAYQFMYYGHQYIGASLPTMKVVEADEIVTELFPRKISTRSPDDADDTIPELVAFWQFLKREFKLSNAAAILDFLDEVQPAFKGLMNNPANFGMAKSFFMKGQAAGFDMTDSKQMDTFMHLHNAAMLAGEKTSPPLPFDEGLDLFDEPSRGSDTKKDKQKKKARRKLARASRKKNRKRQK